MEEEIPELIIEDEEDAEEEIKIDDNKRGELKLKELKKLIKEKERYEPKGLGGEVFVGYDEIKIPFENNLRPPITIRGRENYVKKEDEEFISKNLEENIKDGVIEEIRGKNIKKIKHIIPMGAVDKKDDQSYIMDGKLAEKKSKKSKRNTRYVSIK